MLLSGLSLICEIATSNNETTFDDNDHKIRNNNDDDDSGESFLNQNSNQEKVVNWSNPSIAQRSLSITKMYRNDRNSAVHIVGAAHSRVNT